jgi:hypothetical protein
MAYKAKTGLFPAADAMDNNDGSNAAMEQELDEKVLKEFLETERRLEFGELSQALNLLAFMGAVMENRCAIVNGIAVTLNNLGCDPELITKFCNAQIDKKMDCEHCRACSGRDTEKDIHNSAVRGVFNPFN